MDDDVSRSCLRALSYPACVANRSAGHIDLIMFPQFSLNKMHVAGTRQEESSTESMRGRPRQNPALN